MNILLQPPIAFLVYILVAVLHLPGGKNSRRTGQSFQGEIQPLFQR